jgi:hypothetical protein
MTRLETIANRQRKTLGRDLLFAAFIGLAAIIGAVSVTTAVDGVAHVAKR